MNYGKRIFSALLGSIMLMISLSACGNNKEPEVDYERYKTDIIGVWCDVDGPEYVDDQENVLPHFNMYEFTKNGRLIYHTPNEVGSLYFESTYEIRDNFLTVNGSSSCKIIVDGDSLSMINNGGTSLYRRMSMGEVCNYGIVVIDEDAYMEQIEFTDAFKKNFYGKPYDNGDCDVWGYANYLAAAESAAAETADTAETEADVSEADTEPAETEAAPEDDAA